METDEIAWTRHLRFERRTNPTWRLGVPAMHARSYAIQCDLDVASFSHWE
jgi:hypothetical protein